MKSWQSKRLVVSAYGTDRSKLAEYEDPNSGALIALLRSYNDDASAVSDDFRRSRNIDKWEEFQQAASPVGRRPAALAAAVAQSDVTTQGNHGPGTGA